MTAERRTASLAGRGGEGQARAMARFAVLRPHLEEGVALARRRRSRRAAANGAALDGALPSRRAGGSRASRAQRCRRAPGALGTRGPGRGLGAEAAAVVG